jgi:hypothetical protein
MVDRPEYRLIDTPEGSVDALAGVRLYSLKNKLDFGGPGILGGLSFSDIQTTRSKRNNRRSSASFGKARIRCRRGDRRTLLSFQATTTSNCSQSSAPVPSLGSQVIVLVERNEPEPSPLP